MKTFAIAVLVGAITGSIGFWLGHGRPRIEQTRVARSQVTVSGFVHEYPRESFIVINEELRAKTRELVGDYESQFHSAAVTPEYSGYSVYFAGPRSSVLWSGQQQDKIMNWVSNRMFELHEENTTKQQEAQQGVGLDAE